MKKANNFLILFSCVLLVQLFIHQCLYSQYLVGHTDITFIDSSRNNRQVPLHIFYPAYDTTLNTAVASGIFPLFVFAHGFTAPWSKYEYLWKYLVPKGYIVAVPETETTFTASNNDQGTDVAFSALSMSNESLNPSSLFYQRIGPIAAGGHSMGGASAVLSVNRNPNIISIVSLTPTSQPVNGNFSILDTASTISLPALVVGASLDCITSVDNHVLPVYNALASDCKFFYNITGGNHCQFLQSDNLCESLEGNCGPPATISRAQQIKIIKKYILPWLDYTLKGNASSLSYFTDSLAVDTQITYVSNCINSATENMLKVTDEMFIYPNPANGSFSVHFPMDFSTDGNRTAVLEITNALGEKIIYRKLTDSSESIQLHLPPGIYFACLTGPEHYYSVEKVIIQQ